MKKILLTIVATLTLSILSTGCGGKPPEETVLANFINNNDEVKRQTLEGKTVEIKLLKSVKNKARDRAFLSFLLLNTKSADEKLYVTMEKKESGWVVSSKLDDKPERDIKKWQMKNEVLEIQKNFGKTK